MARQSTLRSSGNLSNLTMESILNSTTKPPTSRKKPKFKETIIGENDRISNLPEPILNHILSFLDTRQAIQTSVLSNTWRTLWKTLTSFSFDYSTFCSLSGRNPSMNVNHVKFLDTVTRVLKKSQPLQLDYFRLFDDSCAEISSRAGMWKLFNLLAHCRVQHLDLKQPACCLSRIFTFKYLVVLELNLCMREIDPSSLCDSVWLPSLETVHFRSVFFTDGTNFIEKFLSKCPLLSKLIMIDCGILGKKHIIITSALLQHIEIDCIYRYRALNGTRNPCKITICTPNLISFKCRSYLSNQHSFKDLSALKDVEIDINPLGNEELTIQQKERIGTEMVRLLRGLHNAESIRVTGLVLEFIALDIEVFVTPFHALRHLMMRTWLSRGTIAVIHCLLEHSYKVETLSLDVIEADVVLGTETPAYCFDCKFNHLRVLKIKGIQGFEEEVEFLKGVLKSAAYLEELIVFKRKDPLAGSEKRLEDMRDTLLGFARESSKINIQLV